MYDYIMHDNITVAKNDENITTILKYKYKHFTSIRSMINSNSFD